MNAVHLNIVEEVGIEQVSVSLDSKQSNDDQ